MALDNTATGWIPTGLQQAMNDLISGARTGFELSGEDRRDLLFELRERENKSEAPRPTTVLAQHPVIDLARQYKTFGDGWLARNLPVPALTDEAVAFRANNQLNIPVGEVQDLTLPRNKKPGESFESWRDDNIAAREALAEELPAYKKKIQQLPGATKAGYALGTLANDFVNNSTRNIWWLINASQAVTDLASEAVTSTVSPDMFSYKPLIHFDRKMKSEAEQNRYASQQYDGLVKQGLLRYTGLEKEILPEFSDEMAAIEALPPEDRPKAIREFEQALTDKYHADPSNYVQSAPGIKRIKGQWKRRRFNPNLVGAAAMIPASYAVNAGIGLLGGEEDSGVPLFGRRAGYEASVPDEDDPRKTANAIAEVANLYIFGREGKKMPYSDFVKERPDVSKSDYNKYEAYERDRGWDLNPFDDGIWNLGGVLKGNMNNDAIHGGEVQFLGKNLDMNTTIIPTLGAIAGTAVGGILPNARRLRSRKKNPYLDLRDAKGDIYSGEGAKFNKYTTPSADPVTRFMGNMPEVANRTPDGFIDREGAYFDQNPVAKGLEKFFTKEVKQKKGESNEAFEQRRRQPPEFDQGKVIGSLFSGGLAGLAGASAIGGAIEAERQRRQFEEDHPHLNYETYKKTSRELADRKAQTIAANPNRKEDREAQGKTGFNSRAYQTSLMEKAQEQQVLIDMMVDEDRKIKAGEAQAEGIALLSQAAQIEREIEARKQGIDPDQQNFNSLGF